MPQLGQPSQGAGAHHGTLRQGVESVVGIFGIHHQGIRWIFPFGDAAQHQALRQVGGQILQRMDGDVRASHQHLRFQFLGEQSFVADLGQSHIQDLVPLGGHRLHRDGEFRVGFLQLRLHPVGLHHRQLTAT